MIVNEIEWTDEDIKLVERFESIRQKGLYVDGKQLTEAYNRLLNKKVNVTNCGSCLRLRVQELTNALNHAREKAAEVLKKQEPINVPKEENKPTEAKIKANKKK